MEAHTLNQVHGFNAENLYGADFQENITREK